MNLLAICIGAAIALFAIIRFKARKLEKRAWLYPLILACCPVCYWVFALYASDFGALLNEIAVGFIYFAVAITAYQWRNPVTLAVLVIGFISHAAYDAMHHTLFINDGTPLWWPEFCGSADILFGLYLLYMAVAAKQLPPKPFNNQP